MSLNATNNSHVIDRQLHHNAKEDTVYLIGRILEITGPNPNYNPNKPLTEHNTPRITEQVTMTAEGVRSSKFTEWVSASPLAFSLGVDCTAKVPTGMKYQNENREHFLDFTGPCIVQHGAVKTFKPLESFFTAV